MGRWGGRDAPYLQLNALDGELLPIAQDELTATERQLLKILEDIAVLLKKCEVVFDAKFKGGNKYKPAIEEITRELNKAKTLKVGFMESAKYPDGTSVPMIAAINEFGAPSRGQPPRPFFRRMIKEKSKEWAPALKNLLKTNGYDAKLSLEQLGDGIAGQLRQSIIELVDPPLSPRTIARKGFDKPLIDTSQMLNSITHEVN